MEFDKKTYSIQEGNKENDEIEINFIEIFEKFTRHWKYFLFGLILSMSIGYIHLRYSIKEYEVSTTIFINDEESGGLSSELSAFEDLGVMTSGAKTSIVNEMGVLKSLTLIDNVVKKLGIFITYYEESNIVSHQLYGDDIPFKINFFTNDSILYNMNFNIKVRAVSDTEFEILDEEDITLGLGTFGKNIETVIGEINVTPADINNIKIGSITTIRIRPTFSVANYYRNKIEIEPDSKKSSLVILSLTDEVKQKALDILNTLVSEYNHDAINYKTLITQNTDEFIDRRINDISIDLTDIDKGVEEFKEKNKLTNLEYEADLVLTSNSEVQKKINDLISQINIIEFVIEHLNNNKDDLIPQNLGIVDATSNQNVNAYNSLVLERNRIIKGSSKLNPTVVNMDSQIATLRQSILQSLSNARSSLNFSLTEAKNQSYRLNQRRDIAPQQEREFQDIKRKQQIIESLYLYLLEKREENAISMGIPVPNAKIIDKANGSNAPVSPKPILVYLVAAILGLIIPFFIISIRLLFDNKIHNHEDIRKVINAPIIGDIPNTRSNDKIIFDKRGMNNITEAFRLVRTNINFMLSGSQEVSKTVFITSTVAGEGKTFISLNLAISLALLDKRVLLIEADIRKPKIASYLKIDPKKEGLTQFLVDKNLSPEKLISHHEKNQFDFIISGEKPPNPSELLLNGRLEDLLVFSKAHYDYILIDTPPVSLVTDTLLLAKYADLFIYVVRAEFLDKRSLRVPELMHKNKRLNNMAMLLNDTVPEKMGYGYGYGYGNEDSDSKWWKWSRNK